MYLCYHGGDVTKTCHYGFCFRYNNRELDSARTWIEPETGTNHYVFDELHLTGGAHLAVFPKDGLTSNVNVLVGELYGDTTGNLGSRKQ